MRKQSIKRIGEGLYELDGARGADRILTLEGMRGVAVILVFFVHYHALFGQQLPADSLTFGLSHFLEIIGHSGVDLFFVLSGYLIYAILMKGPIDLSRFITRRVKRIYPTFLAVFALYLALSVVFPTENKIPAGASAAGVYLLQNVLLLPGMFDIRPLITISWSLSYEFFFYFTIPIVIAAVRLRSWRTSRRVVFFLALSGGLIASSLAGFYPRVQLVLFIVGILGYEALKSAGSQPIQEQNRDRLGLVAIAVTCGLIYVLGLRPGFLHGLPWIKTNWWTYREIVLMLGFFVLFVCSLSATSFLKRALSWTFLRWLGNMSYSYYLIHGLALRGIALVVERFSPHSEHALLVFWVGLPVFFALTWVASTLLFVGIEKRFSLAKTKSGRLRAPAIPVPIQS